MTNYSFDTLNLQPYVDDYLSAPDETARALILERVFGLCLKCMATELRKISRRDQNSSDLPPGWAFIDARDLAPIYLRGYHCFRSFTDTINEGIFGPEAVDDRLFHLLHFLTLPDLHTDFCSRLRDKRFELSSDEKAVALRTLAELAENPSQPVFVHSPGNA